MTRLLPSREFWRELFRRLLSPPTARFILALLALGFAAGGAFFLMAGKTTPDAKDAVVFALGQLFALATIAFNYYFGSTARGDERPLETEITNPPDKPVPVEEEADVDLASR